VLVCILDLFGDESQAQAFVANSDQALADAGSSTVSSIDDTSLHGNSIHETTHTDTVWTLISVSDVHPPY
jgi:hypothetical protein